MRPSSELVAIVEDEKARLLLDPFYDIGSRRRMAIYRAIGPSAASVDHEWGYILGSILPELNAADRVRAWIAVWSARHVAQQWSVACREADGEGLNPEGGDTNDQELSAYFSDLGKGSIENVSAYRIPRQCVPEHILAMTELTLAGRIENPEKLLYEANELWGLYPVADRCPREYSIKWAAQEALYLSVLSQHYGRDQGESKEDFDSEVSPNEYAAMQIDGPCGLAMLAYSGVFTSHHFVDAKKRREFWQWWFDWALPVSHLMV